MIRLLGCEKLKSSESHEKAPRIDFSVLWAIILPRP